MPAVSDAEADGERRDRPERRNLQPAEDEGKDRGDLQRREEAEAEAVAEHDLGSTDRSRQQPFERPADPLAQEADAGQDEDEEVDEEADYHRSERVHGGGVRGAVNGRSFDRRQGCAEVARYCFEQCLLDVRDDRSLARGVQAEGHQLELGALDG